VPDPLTERECGLELKIKGLFTSRKLQELAIKNKIGRPS
jgi:hypothetical protein